MQRIFDFFVDPLIWPVYIYLAAYGFMWLLAYSLARVFMNQSGIERGTTRAWRIAVIAHMLGGTVLVIWLVFRAIPRVSEWWHILLYLIPYLCLILILDGFLLLSLSTQGIKRDEPDISAKPVGKSRNPKKKQ